MKYTVTIRKDGAADETRVVEAPSRFAVYEQIEKEGGTVALLKEGAVGTHAPDWLKVTFGTGIKSAEIITMTKNLAAMLVAGLSLSRALSVIERQSSNKYLKKLMADIGNSIAKGSSLHEALATHKNIFSGLYIAMAKAGEESGSLAESLSIVGLQMERTHALIRKVKGAMIYPAVVIVAVIIVGVLMLMFVVPTLSATFSSLGTELPAATRAIVALSNFITGHFVAFIGVVVALIALVVAFVRSTVGGTFILKGTLRLPVIGELVRETYAARTCRTLSSLLSSGVPVLEGLAITEEVVGAPVFAHVVAEAQARVKKGDPLSAAFSEHTKIYPILVGDMLAVGEETGNVAEMLKKTAEFYEEDVSDKTKDLSTIIEPMLILFIGIFVGIFAVSMIAPIYSLSSVI